jgi:aldehyde dehydrogenase (NAD+)
MTSVASEVRELRHFIDGEWVDGRRAFEDTDPYTGGVVAHVAAGTRAEAAQAVAAAAAAAPAWAQSAPGERQRIFLAAADILERRRDDVVSWLARETGCTFGFGMFQMSFVPACSARRRHCRTRRSDR